jgi:hypothetical protein
MKKIKLIFFTFLFLSLLSSLSLVSAKDSYTINNNQVIFNLSSSTGIHYSATVLKGNEKITKFDLCQEDRCLGQFTTTLNITKNLSGEYTLSYWNYDNYERKTLNFTISSGQAQNNNNPSTANQASNNQNSFFKTATVTTICRFATLLKGNYEECRDRYL